MGHVCPPEELDEGVRPGHLYDAERVWEFILKAARAHGALVLKEHGHFEALRSHRGAGGGRAVYRGGCSDVMCKGVLDLVNWAMSYRERWTEVLQDAYAGRRQRDTSYVYIGRCSRYHRRLQRPQRDLCRHRRLHAR